jgi:hypothetical protein
MHRHVLCTLVVGVAASVSVFAQTTTNPDLSVIPRLIVSTNDGEHLADGKREWSQPDFSFQELEMAIQAYLNPFARADITLTLPGPNVEEAKLGVEEVYATVLRGLPGDMNLRLGKYRAEFGKLNMMHPHAWPFVTQPLVAERFLGEEGLNDLGISVSALLPTGDVYARLTLDLLRGRSLGGGAGIADTTGARPWYATSGRLSGFFSLGEYSDLETGVSLYTGIHDPYNRERFWYWNADFQYKYRPDSYTSLTVQGEYLGNRRQARQDAEYVSFLTSGGAPEEKTISTSGLYIYADYQFTKFSALAPDGIGRSHPTMLRTGLMPSQSLRDTIL